MASTYFHGAPEVQPDGLQTLYLMNPGFAGGGAYADAAAPTAATANMLLLSSTVNSVLNPINQQQQHFVGVPFQQAAAAAAAERTLPMLQYNSWPLAASNSPVEIASQFGGRRTAQQGLSLSLSPHEMAAAAVAEMTPASTGGLKIASAASLLSGSKYLKAAQQLLDEVASVGKGIKDEPPAKAKNPAADAEVKGGGVEDSANLTTAEKHELQMKKAKLASMLEEVEQRYRQYRHQIQIVVSSFESIAGLGSARTYTALALRTISKQFRCLRDAIAGQIRTVSKTMGEEADAKIGGSRLRFIDHHFRQQRALQQLGMMQQNPWRPQRGLPERSVSILRAWLFEHFLHPYPKDSDKIMLAKQTGLTRSQVSNWFINARVRLWKPMVEEMYMQETKDNNGDDTSSKSDANGSSTSKSVAQQESTLRDEDAIAEQQMKKARNATSLQANAMVSVASKRDEASNRELLMQFMDGRNGGGHGGGGNGFGLYPIGELTEQFAPRFAGNGVSLTLGLQHSDSLSIPGAQTSFLPSESVWAGGWR